MRRVFLLLAAGCVADTTGLDGSLRVGTEVGVADTGEHDAGVECCPVGPPICGCVQIGGTKRDGICQMVCDSDPNEWTYSTDENGCTVIDGAPGPCNLPPDAGVPSCTGSSSAYAGTWQLDRSFVSKDSIEYTEEGGCAEIGFDQRLNPITIEADGSFYGRLITDYLDTWHGCAEMQEDGTIRFDVHSCDVTCYGHDREPGRLGIASVGPAGELVLLRTGFALLATGAIECRGCSNDGTMCEALENAWLRMLYTRQ